MRKKEEVVLIQREILVLARERLVSKIEFAKKLRNAYTEGLLSGSSGFMISISQCNEDILELEQQYNYVADMIISLDDRNWVLSGHKL